MAIDSKLKSIISRFEFPGTLSGCRELKTGHINITYALHFSQADGTARDYVLQRINNYVFKKPWEVMENVQLVAREGRRQHGRGRCGRLLARIRLHRTRRNP